MKPVNLAKYEPFAKKFKVDLPNRQWPNRHITQAPQWCSVDLRDGNQALPVPMTVDEKLEYFRLLTRIGFRQIEVGFPSASDTEFAFMRRLIDAQAVPAGVAVQVLVQSREHLIRRTFESLKGFETAVVHLYNSTSRLQRQVTFSNASLARIKQIATDGTKLVRELADREKDTRVLFQYSPESFSDTEVEFAYEVCEAVMDIWQPTAERPIILNLPVTVEWTTPNYHADQIEWFCRQLAASGRRDRAIVSLHTHNDRGTGVACTELALLAGADRVEGTLFGNGERTGNLDIVTVALNMNSHGIPTGLDFSDLPQIRQIYERVTRMRVHERHPYAGDLVFTAFSGSHQDAIKKGMDLRTQATRQPFAKSETEFPWAVPYLTIDPQDIGRTYEAIIRINSQSGKGGVAWVLEREFGLELPKAMQPEVGNLVNDVADKASRELEPSEILAVFNRNFVNLGTPLALDNNYELAHHAGSEQVSFQANVAFKKADLRLEGQGNGPIDALVKAMARAGLEDFRVTSYHSHAVGKGSDSTAVAYVEVVRTSDQKPFWGCGKHPSIEAAGLLALVSAFNRIHS